MTEQPSGWICGFDDCQRPGYCDGRHCVEANGAIRPTLEEINLDSTSIGYTNPETMWHALEEVIHIVSNSFEPDIQVLRAACKGLGRDPDEERGKWGDPNRVKSIHVPSVVWHVSIESLSKIVKELAAEELTCSDKSQTGAAHLKVLRRLYPEMNDEISSYIISNRGIHFKVVTEAEIEEMKRAGHW